ncbi:hypothetical protein AVEN_123120-1 [Araneus ventricosus]|uniref:Uncharacterized protein n=1 Tax=Araneus ventricosus TaxID=182803 RepID=A0A4Y2SQ52_ARAVE|nr:hypothetical protein AVEN_123120-1 [Araneus ventricosus]
MGIKFWSYSAIFKAKQLRVWGEPHNVVPRQMTRTTPELASPSKLSESAVVARSLNQFFLEYTKTQVSKAESEIWKPRDMDIQKWSILQISKARLKMYLQLRPVVAALHQRALTSSNSTDYAAVPSRISSKSLSRKNSS